MHFQGRLRNRLAAAVVLGAAGASLAGPVAAQTIVVQGSQRVDAETIRSYFAGTDQARINQAVRDLYSTGLFSDVRVRNEGGRLIVQVTENSVINRVAFEGNSKVKSDILLAEVQTKARGAYNPATVQADIDRIRDVYRRAGRGAATVTSRTVDLPNGRIDVVYTINEGGKTGVRSIEFVGNQAYSAYRLRGMMQTTEMNFLSWLKNSDVYDPDRISADLELIRRFYLKNGYADFRVIGSDAQFDEARQGWIVTITVDEGLPYTVASVNVDSRIPDMDASALQSVVRIKAGDVYNGDLVEKSVEAIQRDVARKGYAFAAVRPRGDRDTTTHTINLSFVVEEGPRVYVERITIRGNTRTRDYVIRREFELGEGDAYNRVLVERAERRLNSLGFFKRVRVVNEPGSAPDRIVIVVDVEDQPTGSFGISGGYSTQDGFIAEVSISESNFLGRGQFVRASATLGQRVRGVDLSFTEPYFLGYRLAAGVDLFWRENTNSNYALYDTSNVGATLRMGIPLTEQFSMGVRYSIYQTEIKIPNDAKRPYNDCSRVIDGVTPIPPDASFNCMTNGEASLAVKEAAGTWLTSAVGSTLSYSTLDNARNPTSGLFAEIRGDVAGLGGDARWVRGIGDLRYYYPVWENVTLMARMQGGQIAAFGGNDLRIVDNFNLGPSLVRGFAPGGIGPRDISPGVGNNRTASLGGTTYFGGSLELQFPIWGLPREVGLRGALFADAGTLFNFQGKTNFANGGPCTYYAQNPAPVGTNIDYVGINGAYYGQSNCINVYDENVIRSSVGASLLWSSPLGPIRFDYAFALSKAEGTVTDYSNGRKIGGDVTQAFRFSGGTSF
ncbi:MAG: outer membrane protein assembly factor BamA [Beijerinckiaceae bacterium]